jgi:hypothetical protein
VVLARFALSSIDTLLTSEPHLFTPRLTLPHYTHSCTWWQVAFSPRARKRAPRHFRSAALRYQWFQYEMRSPIRGNSWTGAHAQRRANIAAAHLTQRQRHCQRLPNHQRSPGTPVVLPSTIALIWGTPGRCHLPLSPSTTFSLRVNARMCLCVNARMCVCVCMYVCVCMCVYVCMCVCVCECTYACVCVCVCVCV